MDYYRTIDEVSNAMQFNLSVSCLICEQPVKLNEMERSRLNHGLDIHSKICTKCKNAILYYRRKFESGED